MRRAGSARPKEFSVKLAIPLFGEISGTWEPVDAERQAAWELYVELVTRISVVDLDPGEGLLREALTSLYSFFGTTRDILRRYGPDVAPRRPAGHVTFGALAVTVLNGALRPLLARWHPRLTAYEATRPVGSDPVAHERAWPLADELRTELTAVRITLTQLSRALAEVAGAGDLMHYTPVVPPQNSGGGGDQLRLSPAHPRLRRSRLPDRLPQRGKPPLDYCPARKSRTSVRGPLGSRPPRQR